MDTVAMIPTTLAALTEAGFLDAYLNINGVVDEAQAQAMLAADWDHLLALPSADRAALAAELLDEETLSLAMYVAWPTHSEGTGGTGTATVTTWSVRDPAMPSDHLSAAILAALRSPDGALASDVVAAEAGGTE